MRNGVTPIQNWIARLINPDAEPVPLLNPPSPTRQLTAASTSQHRSPPPPGTVPPPLPQTTPTGAPSSLGILARLNQTASQKNLQVTYPAERCGEPHSPQWTVQCVGAMRDYLYCVCFINSYAYLVNGETMGSGIGKSQKIAKEVAAQEAWAALGWS